MGKKNTGFGNRHALIEPFHKPNSPVSVCGLSSILAFLAEISILFSTVSRETDVLLDSFCLSTGGVPLELLEC